MVAIMLCRKCGKRLDKFLVAQQEHYHPGCEPTDPNEVLSIEVLSDIVDVVQWSNNNSSRSLQSTIGPSELGNSCDRRIAYRLAGIPTVNAWTDPWKAIVGTSIHAWMEKSINRFQQVHYMDRWKTEITVQPDPLVTGHCDLYDTEKAMVIDFKTVSKDKMKSWRTQGPPEYYKDQVNLYALGLEMAGQTVHKVAMIAIPRDGQMSEWRMWIDDYSPDRAKTCIARMYGIANLLIEQGDSIDFETIPSEPGPGCSYCPWYRGGLGPADTSGCCGSNTTATAKFGEGLIKPNG